MLIFHNHILIYWSFKSLCIFPPYSYKIPLITEKILAISFNVESVENDLLEKKKKFDKDIRKCSKTILKYSQKNNT